MVGCATKDNNVKLLRSGFNALDAHQYGQALAAADQVLAANPQKTLPSEAHYLRGRALEGQAMANPSQLASGLQQARTEYIAALGLPHTPDLEGRARAGVAIVAFYQDDYATAYAQWQEAFPKLEKPEDRAQTLYRLGQTAQRLGRWDEADNYFAQAQQTAPGTDLAEKARQHMGKRAFTVQLATFADAHQAAAAVSGLKTKGVVATSSTDPENSSHYLLRVGPLRTYAEAKALKNRFAATYPAALILP
jgi:tetratricopeptide (TPR) repeat protein